MDAAVMIQMAKEMKGTIRVQGKKYEKAMFRVFVGHGISVNALFKSWWFANQVHYSPEEMMVSRYIAAVLIRYAKFCDVNRPPRSKRLLDSASWFESPPT